MTTPIEWTDETWNPLRARFTEPVTGAVRIGWHCEHASEGCRFCYAEQRNKGFFQLGTKQPYTRPAREKVEIFLDEDVLQQPLHWKKPRMIFVCSMTDLFGDWHTDEMIDRVFAVMALCPQHTFQVLTKRAERMHQYLTSSVDDEGFTVRQRIGLLALGTTIALRVANPRSFVGKACYLERDGEVKDWPLSNVHLGVSCEDQQTADERIPWLLKTPAAVRWVSYEPAIGPVDFLYPTTLWPDGPPMCCNGQECGCRGLPIDPPLICEMNGAHISWIVIGGESGPGSRPFDIEWARSVLRQRREGHFKAFVKQLGSKPTTCRLTRPQGEPAYWTSLIKDKKGGDINEWPADLRVREFPEVAK